MPWPKLTIALKIEGELGRVPAIESLRKEIVERLRAYMPNEMEHLLARLRADVETTREALRAAERD